MKCEIDGVARNEIAIRDLFDSRELDIAQTGACACERISGVVEA